MFDVDPPASTLQLDLIGSRTIERGFSFQDNLEAASKGRRASKPLRKAEDL
jgi:hypothetical protein